MTDVKRYIELGQSPFQSKVITFEDFAEYVQNSCRHFFIYGASPTTEYLLDRMFNLNLLPRCLCDSDVNKHGQKMFMLPVVSPENAIKDNPNAICAIAIRAIATCYDAVFSRLEAAGCRDYYIIDWDFCHYTVPDEWKSDLANHMEAVISCANRFDDALSCERYSDFILSFLSGKVSSRDCLASFKSKDGHPLKNDLFELRSEDTLLSCRCGLDRQNEVFIKLAQTARQAHLLEPTLSGRVRTSELLSETEDCIFLYPYFPSNEKDMVEFEERHCYVKYIDLEDFSPARARPVAIDAFKETGPTVLYFDMTSHNLSALESAKNILKKTHPTVIIKGFRLGSEVSEILTAYPDFKWYFRHFGGQNMREGYALIGRVQ